MTSQTNGRKTYLDVAKGIGILGVILGHHILCLGHGEYRWLTDWFWSFHMPMFFIISGYFFRSDSIRATLTKALGQLVRPYYLTVYAGIFVCIAILFRTGTYTGPSIVSWLWGALVLDPAYEQMAMWFIPALFFGKVYMTLVYRYLPRREVFAVVALFLIAVALKDVHAVRFTSLSFMHKGLMVPLFLYVGQRFRQLDVFECAHSAEAYVLALLSVGFASWSAIDLNSLAFPNGFFSVCSCVLISWAVIVLCHGIEQVRVFRLPVAVLSFFGRHSLYFLCSHAFLFTIQLQRHIPVHDTLLMGCIAVMVALFGWWCWSLVRHLSAKIR